MKKYPLIGYIIELAPEKITCLSPLIPRLLSDQTGPGENIHSTDAVGVTFKNIRDKVIVWFFTEEYPEDESSFDISPVPTVEIEGYSVQSNVVHVSGLGAIGFFGPFSKNFEDSDGWVHIDIAVYGGAHSCGYVGAFRIP